MSETTHHTLNADGFDFGVRVYPAAAPNGSVLVWLHGGAFMFGTIDMPEADEVARRLSETGTTVVSVDYTLGPLDGLDGLPGPEEGTPGPSPEQFAAELAAAGPRSPYPTASLQTVAAFEWARANAHTWGADPRRVSLGGASAGGNLSAGAAVRLRDAGGDAPASLLLVYPVLHSELPAGRSRAPRLPGRVAARADVPARDDSSDQRELSRRRVTRRAVRVPRWTRHARDAAHGDRDCRARPAAHVGRGVRGGSRPRRRGRHAREGTRSAARVPEPSRRPGSRAHARDHGDARSARIDTPGPVR